MKRLLLCLAALVVCSASWADDHGDIKAEVLAAAEAFNDAYATNDIDAYFGMYAKDVEAYWYGERVDFAAYYAEWLAMIEAGGGVVKNDMSDIKVQIMPGKDIAIISAFVYNETRSPDGDVEIANAFETDVWRKTDGEWKVVNLHFTVINPEE